MTGWYIGALFPLLEAMAWRKHWRHQLKFGADAPCHFEAAEARGHLDEPFFGKYQPSGPGTHWAYVGPRPMLMIYWLFLPIWRKSKPGCCVAWQFFMALCTWAALGILWPHGMSLGWWCMPLLALLVWSGPDTGMLGASNPVALLLLALGLTAGGPVAAGAWFGAAVAIRLWPLGYAPLMAVAHPGWFAGAQMLTSAAVVAVALTALAWHAGFGYERLRAYRALFKALNVGPIARLTAFHKRRPYALMAAPFIMWPTLAAIFGVLGCVWVACFLNTKRHAQEFPMDVAFVWHTDWNGNEYRT